MKILNVSKESDTSLRKAAGSRSGSIKRLDPYQPHEGVHDNRRLKQMEYLVDTSSSHSWTRATVSTITKSSVGAGLSLVKSQDYENEATEDQRRQLLDFMYGPSGEWNNINDFMQFSGKLEQSLSSFILLGQFGWEIQRNKLGEPVGYDPMSGYVIPNVDERGYFKSPAFIMYPWKSKEIVEYDSAEDVVYVRKSGVKGDIRGESDYESLVHTTIPADLFASVAYRGMFENVNSPYNGIWVVNENIADEDFEFFLALLEERYSGVGNYGRNPLVVKGDAEWRPVKSRSEEDAPYLEGRRFNQEEISAVTGVHSSKLGITSMTNKSNMRETRRDFYENTLLPVHKTIEEQLYWQVNVRLFGYRGWKWVFNDPDFTTQIEDATIAQRYWQVGALNPNEVREKYLGLKPREGGDTYTTLGGAKEENGEGERNNQPADGASESHDNQREAIRPPRDEESPDSVSVLKVAELKAMRKFTLRAMDGKTTQREFVPAHLSPEEYQVAKVLLRDHIESGDFNSVKTIFNVLIKAYGENYE